MMQNKLLSLCTMAMVKRNGTSNTPHIPATPHRQQQHPADTSDTPQTPATRHRHQQYPTDTSSKPTLRLVLTMATGTQGSCAAHLSTVSWYTSSVCV